MKFKTITNNSSELTYSDITQIITQNIESEANFVFVCDKNLAEFICNYLMDTYDIIDEDMTLEDDIQEYYVSMYFSDEDDDINFFCESAKGINKEYKLNDIDDDYVDYYICNNLDENIAFDKLLGKNATWHWIGVNMEDDNEECEYNDCECDGCCEKCEVEDYEDDDEDEGINYEELLDIFVERIQEADGCCDYIRNVLNDFANIFIPEEDECDKTEDCGECENKCQEYYDCEDENVETEAVCDDKCDTCEIPDEICEEINLINEVAEMIEDGDMCPVCLRNVLYDLYIKGKNIG